jgi:hypothetical protein
MSETLTFKHEMYISSDGTIAGTQDELIRIRQERDEAEEGRILLGQALQAAVDDRNYEVQKLKAERDEARSDLTEAVEWLNKLDRWNNDDLGEFLKRMKTKGHHYP